jgi:shikimate kinase
VTVIVKQIYLIGPMGSGKSTLGRALAARLGVAFIDTDAWIEADAGYSIPEIFACEGEAAFREREIAAVQRASESSAAVVATGGGAVLRAENRECMQRTGTVIYLHANVDTLLARTAGDRNRPLLQVDNPRAKIESLLAEREPLYRATAHVVVATANLSLDEAVECCLRACGKSVST